MVLPRTFHRLQLYFPQSHDNSMFSYSNALNIYKAHLRLTSVYVTPFHINRLIFMQNESMCLWWGGGVLSVHPRANAPVVDRVTQSCVSVTELYLQLTEEQRALRSSSALLETMEVVLTRLRDFSCKETSFDECKAAGMCRDHSSSPEVCRGKRTAGDGDSGRLDIETALAWLRKELVRF